MDEYNSNDPLEQIPTGKSQYQTHGGNLQDLEG